MGKVNFSGDFKCDAVRQITLIQQAGKDSGKVYGYRKLNHDLRDQGERCSPNRIARPILSEIKVQVGVPDAIATSL